MFRPLAIGLLCCFINMPCLFLPFVSLAREADELPVARSFAGAYLAGRIASSNNDMQAAVNYFQQALGFEPEHEMTKQDLFVTLLAGGKFEQSLSLATNLAGHPDVGRFSRLVLAADAFNKSHWGALDNALEEDVVSLDRDAMDTLVATLISAWGLLGQGDEAGAISKVAALSGPGWYDMFRRYNLALMGAMAGENTMAETEFDAMVFGQEGSVPSPDIYERAVYAYAVFKWARGDRQGAIELLQQGQLRLSGRHVLAGLRENLEKGRGISPLISHPSEGAAEALYTIGTAISRSGGESYGQLYLNLALALRPRHDASLFQRAEIANKMGRHHEALDDYRQIAPDSAYFRDANMQMALTLAQLDQEEEAIVLLEDLLAQNAQDDAVAMTLAGIYMQTKNFTALVDRLSPYIEGGDAPAPWRLFYQRGIAYERLNLWDKAESDFRAALRLAPDQPQVLNYLGYSLIDRNLKLDEALDMVSLAVSLRPQDGYIVDSLGWAYYKLGRYDQAVEELERAVKLRPEDATINDHLGDAYWRVGRRLEATFQWNHAVVGKPEAEELVKIEEKLKNGLQETHETE